MFKWFKKKKNVQPTIEYIEQKYEIKLEYPFMKVPFDITDDPFYNELKWFGCSDIFCGTSCLHRDCWRSSKIKIDLITGQKTVVEEGDCKNCNFYPIVKEFEDSINIKKVRIKKLNKNPNKRDKKPTNAMGIEPKPMDPKSLNFSKNVLLLYRNSKKF